MDELDQRLMDAWEQVSRRLLGDPNELAKRLKRLDRPTLTRPLRSWCLVVRANDKRLDEFGQDELVVLTRGWVERLCRPIFIGYPGVRPIEAAKLFGVQRTTIDNWARKGKLIKKRWVNRADRKRDDVRVWSPRAILPGGEVWSGDWGDMAHNFADAIEKHFEQKIVRVRTPLHGKLSMWLWRCPRLQGGCGEYYKKLYWPRPVWTMIAAMGSPAWAEHDRKLIGQGFVCRKCAGLLYESTEVTSKPTPGRTANTWDRYVKRISGGLMNGREVDR